MRALRRRYSMFRMGTTRTILTFEEFENLPSQPGKCELLRGELLELPAAKLRHNRLSHRIYKRLEAALEAGTPAARRRI